MCISLKEYREYLEKLVAEKSPQLFSNGGKEYASILMSILLKNTTNSVCIFCEGFRPLLIKEKDYWEALNAYLSEKERTLRVLVNSNSFVNEDPLQTLFKEQKNRNNDNTIQVRLISDNGREIIKNQFNGALNNFAVFDQDMYRLEYDPEGFKAFGSFNQPEDANILLNLFNNVFEESAPINGTAD